MSWVLLGVAPSGPVTETALGRWAEILVLKPTPRPLGVKTSVWLSGVLHLPGTFGESCGLAEPRTSPTFLEKVRRIGCTGDTLPSGPGLTTATGVAVFGNQETVSGLPSFSHERAATATWTAPAAGLRPSETESAEERSRWVAPPSKDTALTGWS